MSSTFRKQRTGTDSVGHAGATPVLYPSFSVYKHEDGTDYGALADTSGLVLGDAHAVLSAMPKGCVQTVVTSPPYWSLRDYGIHGQVGREASVYDFIDVLADLFDEVWRVLRDDGTLWLNIGDSYTSGGRTWRAPDKKNVARAMQTRPDTPEGLKSKDLIGVPWRLAFAMQDRGWYLRTDLIWNKPNAQPESVRDRPTRSHEYVFLFSKSERYKYDIDAVKGPNERRLRSVWDIKTQVYREAAGHFATFPPSLVDPCVLIGSEPGDLVLDPFIGSGTTALSAGLLHRRFVGIELNPDYLEMARNRLTGSGFIETPCLPAGRAGHG
ncbi:MAG TPA: site-specific DNA-methyltransferase [Pseudonocardiaceae bacterium]|jgi:DNA modification methylase|nr:site-specific DNA-methyltransferase [Pseudonocardiaceae bacterium]